MGICRGFKTIFPVFIISLLVLLNFCVAEEQEADDNADAASETEKVSESTIQTPDEGWTTTAIKDIAYFLRNHKFNEWDRRYYHKKPQESLVGYFASFPLPPLRSLHWKIYDNCNSNFYQCIIYLHSIISTAPFTRSDDTVVILNENSVSVEDNSIENMDTECKKALLNSEKSGLPFDSPLEKFQWRVSASYYMCWYTMLGTPALSMLGEACDNFANCLEPTHGHHNRDARSDDRLSFACAMYSFCPDPCCPLKHTDTLTKCYDNEANPCYAENSDRDSERQCRWDRKDNQNLKDIIANKWNVSCNCKDIGFQWKSQYGMCVDINECVTGVHTCNKTTEDCLNLSGTYHCICKWGFAFDQETKKCVQNKVLAKIDETGNENNNNTLVEKFKSIIKLFWNN